MPAVEQRSNFRGGFPAGRDGCRLTWQMMEEEVDLQAGDEVPGCFLGYIYKDSDPRLDTSTCMFEVLKTAACLVRDTICQLGSESCNTTARGRTAGALTLTRQCCSALAALSPSPAVHLQGKRGYACIFVLFNTRSPSV